MHLQGSQAFYNQPNYEQVTKRELESSSPPEIPIYTYESGSKWVRIPKELFFAGASLALIYTMTTFCLKKISSRFESLPRLPKYVKWITNLAGSYRIIQITIGYAAHPLAFPLFFPIAKLQGADFDKMRGGFSYGHVAKRLSVVADGALLDVVVVGKRKAMEDGKRCMLFSLGNAQPYETEMISKDYLALADRLNAVAVFFNPATCGRSSGWFPHPDKMVASHHAMLSFVEEELGVEEIVDWGHSIGAGLQGEDIKDYPFKENKKYAFVKSKSFDNLSEMGDHFAFDGAKYPVKFFWRNYDSYTSSKNLQHPEIIIQQGTHKERGYRVLDDVSQLKKTDDVIPAKRSIAKAILEDTECPKDRKILLAASLPHMAELEDIEYLAKLIEQQLTD